MPDISPDAVKDILSKLDKPDLRFEFPPEADRAPLKMTYGLEMDIRRMLPDPETAMHLMLSDPFTQDYVIRRCLTPLNKIITDPEKELIPAEEVNLDGDTTEALLMWAAQHAIYFFAKRTAGLANLGVQFHELMKAQQPPSSDGSENSPSKTPSAGDSDASKAT